MISQVVKWIAIKGYFSILGIDLQRPRSKSLSFFFPGRSGRTVSSTLFITIVHCYTWWCYVASAKLCFPVSLRLRRAPTIKWYTSAFGLSSNNHYINMCIQCMGTLRTHFMVLRKFSLKKYFKINSFSFIL